MEEYREMDDCVEVCTKEGALRKGLQNFWHDESGVGVVEIILVLVVLIGLVILFKDQLSGLVQTLLSKVVSQSNSI